MVFLNILLDMIVTDLSSAAVCNHGNSSLDAQSVSLPVTEPLDLSLKLGPSKESWLTCTHTQGHTHTVLIWMFNDM